MNQALNGVLARVEAGDGAVVVALVSDEALLLSEAVQSLRQATLSKSTAPDFNRDEFDGRGLDGDAVVRAAQTLPMLAPQRFIHVSDIHKAKAAETAVLAAYIKSPAPTAVVCLSGEKLDKRQKLGKSLGSKAIISLQGPTERTLARFIADRGEQKGTPIARDAADLLSSLIGCDVGAIDRTLERLDLYGGSEAPISTADIEATVSPTKVHSIFALTDAIGCRQLGRASTLLRNAIDGGEAGLKVLALVARQFRLLLRAKGAAGNDRDLARTLGLPPFLVGSIRQQAQGYSRAELRHALAMVGAADVSMKSTRIPHGVILDRLLIEVMA